MHISLHNVTYKINSYTILDNISFSVDKGSFISIIGSNGAGKSTLIKCMNRILKPSSGIVKLNGKNISSFRGVNLAQKISYVPQMITDLPWFTTQEFLMMSRYPYQSFFHGNSGTDDRTAVETAMEQTETAPFKNRFLPTLSGGEKQKVMIAAALAQESDIILLDEPTSFLDPKYHDEVISLLFNINRKLEKTIISVTHDINSAILTSDLIIALKKGKLSFYGKPDDITESSILDEIYDKKFHFAENPLLSRKFVLPGYIDV